MFSVKNVKCRVKGLVLWRYKTVLSGFPGYYDLESVKKRAYHPLAVFIFAVADVT